MLGRPLSRSASVLMASISSYSTRCIGSKASRIYVTAAATTITTTSDPSCCPYNSSISNKFVVTQPKTGFTVTVNSQRSHITLPENRDARRILRSFASSSSTIDRTVQNKSQTQAEPTIESNANISDAAADVIQINVTTPPNDKLTIPGAQQGGGRKLAIVYTCNVCQTRAVKQFSERAYTSGVVLVRCPGCQNLHLIADRLGYIDDSKNFDLESIAEQTGQPIQKITDLEHNQEGVLELILGSDKVDELRDKANQDAAKK